MATQAERGQDGAMIESTNPATGEVLGTVPVMTEEQVNAAVRRARAAAERWAALGFEHRKGELDKWRRALAAEADEIAEIIHLENGKPRLDAIQELLNSLGHLSHAASRAARALRTRRVSPGVLANFRASISYQPLGVVGVIGPWNYPLFTPMGSIAYALAAGNAVVFKPSELTPLVAQRIGEIAANTFAIDDLFQVVTGDGRTGAALARSNVDKIAFTGSARTGRRVMMAAAENLTPVLMELGGKDPMVVTRDADIDKAAEAAVFGALTNAGQACVSIERCYVEAPVYREFVDRVLEHARDVRAGGDGEAQIGAITMAAQVDVIRDHLEDAVARGATVLLGGPDHIRGRLVAPTVLTDVTPEMKIMREETFGPVLPIARVDSADEAIELANDSDYGLGSAIFGKERVRELADRIRAGMTAINSVMAYSAVPNLPFGGVGESGFGRIHGDEGLREFSRTKATAEQRFALPMNPLSFRQPKGAYQQARKLIEQLYGGGVVDRARGALSRLLR
jgi:acyl-CoA reductase-like NAD-dependent aldehyde dehydrogenase